MFQLELILRGVISDHTSAEQMMAYLIVIFFFSSA